MLWALSIAALNVDRQSFGGSVGFIVARSGFVVVRFVDLFAAGKTFIANHASELPAGK